MSIVTHPDVNPYNCFCFKIEIAKYFNSVVVLLGTLLQSGQDRAAPSSPFDHSSVGQ